MDDPLVQTLKFALHSVRDSRGWQDYAEQVAAHVRRNMPTEAEALDQIHALKKEVNDLKMAQAWCRLNKGHC